MVGLKYEELTIVSNQSSVVFVMVKKKIPYVITVKHTMQK